MKLATPIPLQRLCELGQVSRAGLFIRGYVLAPYQKVKDERTQHETGNVEAVLDGDLEPFMESWLRWRRAQQG